MWTPEIVMARLVEAADTVKYLRGDGPAACRSFWPEFQKLGMQLVDGHDKPVDVWSVVYDDAARADFLDRWSKDQRAPDGAISRLDECSTWLAEYVRDPLRRRIVLVWAHCRASGRSFETELRRLNVAKTTAYRRVTEVVERITRRLVNDRKVLRMPDERFLEREDAIGVQESHTLAPCVQIVAVPNQPYRTEPSRDLIATPEDAEAFAAWLADRNAKEARRRRKLGLEDAA